VPPEVPPEKFGAAALFGGRPMSRLRRSLRLLRGLERARLAAFAEADEAGELLDGTAASVALVKAEGAIDAHDTEIGYSRLGGGWRSRGRGTRA